MKNRLYLALLAVLLFISNIFIFQACKKATEEPVTENEIASRRRPPSPPPPVYFYFDNCSHPTTTGNFVAGAPTAATFSLHYINSPGGAYPAYSSAIVNGVKLTAPAGTMNKGSGNILFTAVGTPVDPGYITIPVSVGGSIACNLSIAVLNAPITGPCADPATAPGSTGCVTFTYRGQQVTYRTVRANDGKIWIQQNLGSAQVALSGTDVASYGHYFQWGRWDDGHQVPTGPAIAGTTSLQNPSHISAGNSNFIKGNTASTTWWGTGGLASNTWSGNTPSATNGKDPCAALGAGWHMPSATEWTNVLNAEWISDNISAFDSRLKLTESGYRNFETGAYTPGWVGGYYWSSTAANNNVANNLFFDAAYNAFVTPMMYRGYGAPCRCVKN
jgi:uncharacterized protein (TIGR02145 family)